MLTQMFPLGIACHRSVIGADPSFAPVVATTEDFNCKIAYSCKWYLMAVLALPCEIIPKAMHAAAHMRSEALERTVSGTTARTYADFAAWRLVIIKISHSLIIRGAYL